MAGVFGGLGRAFRSLLPGRRGASASLDGSAPNVFPYDAASLTSTELGDWMPWIRSPDSEINLYRDRIVARTRDLVRNDGWATGVVGRILDSTIGGEYRLSARPDYRALTLFDKSFDHVWADEFRRAAEALWRGFAEDANGRWNDVERKLTISQQFRLALRHKLVDGESLALAYWMPDRVGYGAASYATSFKVIDPDLLSNPFQQVDTRNMRGGVEIDDDGVAVAYHIRRAHQNDWYDAVEANQWERVLREDEDGWRRVFHDFELDRAGQNRGVSVFAPVLSRLKMLARYYGVELQAATINSIFGTFVTSPYDPQLVEEALDADGKQEEAQLSWYQSMRSSFHNDRKLTLNGARIPILAPGEKLESVAPSRPSADFSPFTHEMLRSVAAVLGVSAEQVTQDYSETNYSSARAGIVEAEKAFRRRLADFNANTAGPFYANWLDEAMSRGDLPLPRSAPDFAEARAAYSRCRWLGPGRGWVDPVAERQGAVLGLDAGFSTLEEECAAQGMDWEENIAQRAAEIDRFRKAGLPLPQWFGEPANQVSQKPTAE